MKKLGVGNFSIGGSIFYYSILTPELLFYAGQYSIWHRRYFDFLQALQAMIVSRGYTVLVVFLLDGLAHFCVLYSLFVVTDFDRFLI